MRRRVGRCRGGGVRLGLRSCWFEKAGGGRKGCLQGLEGERARWGFRA